jgi:uncharacterized heparinase superfamily protein
MRNDGNPLSEARNRRTAAEVVVERLTTIEDTAELRLSKPHVSRWIGSRLISGSRDEVWEMHAATRAPSAGSEALLY